MIKHIDVKPIILCGGFGSRLWPLSRSSFPKQFLNLVGDTSLFQASVLRAMSLSNQFVNVSNPIIIANEEHRFLVLDQMQDIEIKVDQILLEPLSKNTAPALTMGALAAIKDGEDSVLVVIPSDQTIADIRAFNRAINEAIRLAFKGAIVTIGVTPDRVETGFGYMKAVPSSASTFKVERFIEKPNEDMVKEFLADRKYFWNAGIFILKASVWLQAIDNFRPDIANATRVSWLRHSTDGVFVRPGASEFALIPPSSIDYAVIEHCPDSHFPIGMIPLDAGWSDLGAWSAISKSLPQDHNRNSMFGDAISYNCKNTLLYSTSRLVASVGVQNLAIVETPDVVLVVEKTFSQDVKRIVSNLESQNRNEHLVHRKVHRPWGWYKNIDEGDRFKVKRIQVKPGASLSLQKHHYRAEHWIVVKGIAEIVCGANRLLLHENQSTFIPIGEIHRLTNPGKDVLEIIEIQSGSYLGEDDIVRFEDLYGRSS